VEFDLSRIATAQSLNLGFFKEELRVPGQAIQISPNVRAWLSERSVTVRDFDSILNGEIKSRSFIQLSLV
jgi:hypothetical protein